MKKKHILLAALGLISIAGCKHDKKYADISISPEAGANYKSGEKVDIKVSYPADLKADSVVYLLDSTRLGSRKDSSAFSVPTDTLGLGARTVTAKVYSAGSEQEVSTNFNLLPSKAPEVYTYTVEKTFPHDTASFTEGLEYHDGIFYESDGGYCKEGQKSSLRKVEVNTGKILQKVDNDCNTFAEGVTVIDGKVIQLTYHEHVGYVYDKNLKLQSKFSYTQGPEGWGLCNDGKYLYNTIGDNTGTNRIMVVDKDKYTTVREIDVYDDKGPVINLNELEYIDGLLYANIWQNDDIIVIDPKTGAVLRRINFAALTTKAHSENPNADVLNGIAWDAAGKRMFVTGKNWAHLYQVKLAKPAV